MHLILTDRLTCPRCGPEFGLILLAHRVVDRRVLSGDLGCANCRENYPISDGFADLRPPPREPFASESPVVDRVLAEARPDSESAEDEERSLRNAALMGVTDGAGTVLVKGPEAFHARSVSRLAGGTEVIAVHPSLRLHPEEPGVSRMTTGSTLPLFQGSVRAILLSGPVMRDELGESLRVLAPQGRIVVLQAPEGFREALEAEGVRILLEENGVLVGEQTGSHRRPLVTLRGP